ncbi:MAG: pyridoxamine 5'-phosphate oxidase family protein [Cyanobacteria bacterium J06598_3]
MSEISSLPSAAPTIDAITEALAPWRSPLSRALHRNRAQPFARYLQLATVRPDGTPANRTIVFRGFLANTNRLMFICDRRSEKTHHTHQNPAAEACWYFTKTREQFRLSGQLTLITAETAGTECDRVELGTTEPDGANKTQENTDSKKAQLDQRALLAAGQQARHTVWQNISANAKIQFAWPHPKEPRAEAAAFAPSAPDEQTPPPTFCLLLLTVHQVDHLALRGEPQNRTLYQLAQEPMTALQAEPWETISVNP